MAEILSHIQKCFFKLAQRVSTKKIQVQEIGHIS